MVDKTKNRIIKVTKFALKYVKKGHVEPHK
jgi:hypothetical protein